MTDDVDTTWVAKGVALRARQEQVRDAETSQDTTASVVDLAGIEDMLADIRAAIGRLDSRLDELEMKLDRQSRST